MSSIEPPPEVTRIRDAQGFIAVRGPDRCDYCRGSLWAWTYTRWRGEISPSGRDWVCWLDLEMIPPWTAL